MKKGQSLNRKFKRGHLKSIWNETFKRPDVFRKTKRGFFVLTNPFVANSTIGRSIRKEEFKHMENKLAS